MEIKISVIIPTYNRKDLLKKSLEALVNQSLNKNAFEVIVVDDGGSDNTEILCADYKERLNIRYYWQPDKGFRAGKARNIGITAAEGKYIVFTDAGVLLHQDALSLHLKLHHDSLVPAVCIGYVYGFEVEEAMMADISSLVSSDNVSGAVDMLEKMHALDIRQNQYNEFGYNVSSWPAPFDIFWTCHVSAEKKALMNAGLFDEAFNCWGGEDVDLGVRLFMQNNRFIVNRRLCSIHFPHDKLVQDHKNYSETAGKKIHQKYQLWQTSFYGCDLGESKFSLNKVIRQYADQNQEGNDAFIRKYLYQS